MIPIEQICCLLAYVWVAAKLEKGPTEGSWKRRDVPLASEGSRLDRKRCEARQPNEGLFRKPERLRKPNGLDEQRVLL